MDADSSALNVSPQDRDLWIRTVIGEAAGDPSAPGVANVIANRMKSSGGSAASVVLAPGQFEPWATRSGELMSYAPTSPAYKNAAQIVDGVIAGKAPDPTNGATHFYAPVAQAALGRAPPKWDDGTGVQIGAHKFFGGQSASAAVPDLLGSWASKVAPPASASAAKGSAPALEAIPDLLGKWQVPQSATPAPAATTPAPSQFSPDDPRSRLGVFTHPETAGQNVNVPSTVDRTSPISAQLAAANSQGMTNLGNAVSGVVPAIRQNFNTGLDLYNQGTQEGVAGHALPSFPSPTDPNTWSAGGLLKSGAGVAGAILSPVTGAVQQLVENPTAQATGSANAGERAGFVGNALAMPILARAGNGALGSPMKAAVGPGVANVSSVLSDIGMSPAAARSALARMGPAATLADIDPALTTEAGGLAAKGGAPTSILKGAMAQRAAQADNRVSAAIDQTLGPKPDLTAVKDTIQEQASSSAAPYYDAARASAAPMNITPVLNSIDAQLKNAVGGEAAVLNKAKAYLTDQKVGLPGPDGSPTTMIVPKDDAGALLKVRQALDGDMESLQRNGSIDGTSAGKSALRAASDIRGQLDDVLKSDDNIAQGDANFAYHMNLKDAVDNGTELFTKGVRTEDFQRSLAAMSPEQLEATRQGARIAIGDVLEQARRGELSGAQSMFAKASANRAKLDALFPNASNVFDMVHGETAMRATEQRVAQNSATAERQAVMEKYSPPKGSSAPSIALPLAAEALGGAPLVAATSAAKAGFSGIRNALTAAGRSKMMEGTARGLVSTGADQDAFLSQIARLQATSPLLTRGNALAGLLAGGVGARNKPVNALTAPYP